MFLQLSQSTHSRLGSTQLAGIRYFHLLQYTNDMRLEIQQPPHRTFIDICQLRIVNTPFCNESTIPQAVQSYKVIKQFWLSTHLLSSSVYLTQLNSFIKQPIPALYNFCLEDEKKADI